MTLRIWHVVFFLIAFAAFAIALAPAALLAPARDGERFNYASIEGTIWSGRVNAARLGGYSIDALDWRVAAVDLLLGKLTVLFRATGPVAGDGAVTVGLGGDKEARIGSLRAESLMFGKTRFAGETRIEDLRLGFKNGACAAALGKVSTEVLRKAGAALGFAGPQLSGEPSCNGPDIELPMRGLAADGGEVAAVLRLKADGSGEWRLSAKDVSKDAMIGLAAAGFSHDQAQSAMVRSGELRWFPF